MELSKMSNNEIRPQNQLQAAVSGRLTGEICHTSDECSRRVEELCNAMKSQAFSSESIMDGLAPSRVLQLIY